MGQQQTADKQRFDNINQLRVPGSISITESLKAALGINVSSFRVRFGCSDLE